MGLNINTLHIFFSTQIILFNIESAVEVHLTFNLANDFRVQKKTLSRTVECPEESQVPSKTYG